MGQELECLCSLAVARFIVKVVLTKNRGNYQRVKATLD